MKQHPIRPLRSDADYDRALVAFETFFDHEPVRGTAEADQFELLGMVIAKYEEEHFPFSAAEPVETIRLVMEGRGYRTKDLARVLGSESRASEILSGRRGLSMDHVRRLHKAWRIPAENLIGGPSIGTTAMSRGDQNLSALA